MENPTTTPPNNPYARHLPMKVLLAMAIAGSTTTQASYWNVQTGATADNEGIANQRLSATWLSAGTRWGYPQLKLSYHRMNTGALAGIPGGTIHDVGLLGTWIAGVKTVKLTGVGGFEILQDPGSWHAEFQADWNTNVLLGMRTTFGAASGGMGGWLARDVRATSAKFALGWDGPRTWAEIGTQIEDRSGGKQPESELPVSLPYDRVYSAWAWGTRAWTKWLQMGLASSMVNSTVETHQPVGLKNDTLQWVDVPYESPHESATLAGLLRLSYGPAWFSTAWPLWSTERRRVESVYLWDTPYWYTLENVAMAEVKAGGDFVLFKSVAIGLEGSALSRPYAPREWFTGNAWNRYGLNLTFRFAS